MTDYFDALHSSIRYDMDDETIPAPALLVTETGPKLARGTKIVIYGKRGAGKSWLGLKMAVDFAGENDANFALFADLDRNPVHVVNDRLRLLRWDKRDRDTAGMLGIMSGLRVPPSAIPEHSTDDLVVFDGAGALRRAVAPGGGYSDDAVLAVEQSVINPLLDKGTTVVVIGHTAKNGDGSSVLGSERWESMADYVVHVTAGKPFDRATAGYLVAELTKCRDGSVPVGPLARMTFEPGKTPLLLDAMDGEGTAVAERMRLADTAVKADPGKTDKALATDLAAKHPELGSVRSWQRSVAAARNNPAG